MFTPYFCHIPLIVTKDIFSSHSTFIKIIAKYISKIKSKRPITKFLAKNPKGRLSFRCRITIICMTFSHLGPIESKHSDLPDGYTTRNPACFHPAEYCSRTENT